MEHQALARIWEAKSGLDLGGGKTDSLAGSRQTACLLGFHVGRWDLCQPPFQGFPPNEQNISCQCPVASKLKKNFKLQIFPPHGLFYFILFYFILFLLFFKGCTHGIWKFPGQGQNWSCSCRPTPILFFKFNLTGVQLT